MKAEPLCAQNLQAVAQDLLHNLRMDPLKSLVIGVAYVARHLPAQQHSDQCVIQVLRIRSAISTYAVDDEHGLAHVQPETRSPNVHELPSTLLRKSVLQLKGVEARQEFRSP